MNENFKKCTDKLKIVLFILTMAFFFVVGLLFFARPKVSEGENRELTKFPEFSTESFLSGEWTANINLWYADTYPLREGMIGANRKLESLYGIGGEMVYGSGSAEDIPDAGGDIVFNPTDDGKGDAIDGLYVNGDTAYELYYFVKQSSDNYVYLINSFAEQIGDRANIYNMLVPKHYEIALSDETVKKLGASDCEEAIEYMYGNMADNVTPVRIIPELIKHNSEYLYFRTDHHWTARGAYYAYTAFCRQKGITPTPLSSYTKTGKADGFLGSLYLSDKNKNHLAMEKNPDYIESFVPNGTNRLEVYNADGTYYDWFAIVNTKATQYSTCFISGDRPLIKIHNDNISDGSSIVVIKESFGNAFVPFLVDSYEYVYVIDYRHWNQHNNNLADFVIDNDIDDVLFLNVIGNSSASDNINALKGIIE